MKAIVQDRYGPAAEVLRLQEIAKPVAEHDQVLVRVRATSVHPDVWHVVTGRPWVLRLMGAGLSRPKNPVPGTDLAGVVESVGAGVTRFRAGDEVFGETHLKLQWRHGGAFAEYAAVPQDSLALKPEGLTFEAAAAVPTPGYIAVLNLGSGELIRPGQHVLINGAGGGVGSIAVQLAKSFGAKVTGVDTTRKLELVRALGAEHVIDFTREDVTRRDERYDLILDVASTLSLRAAKRVLTPRGTYTVIGHDHFGAEGRRILGSLPRFLGLIALSPFEKHLPSTSFAAPSKREVMTLLKKLLEEGTLTPVVDTTFALEEATAAMRYMEEGRACGRIIITP